MSATRPTRDVHRPDDPPRPAAAGDLLHPARHRRGRPPGHRRRRFPRGWSRATTSRRPCSPMWTTACASPRRRSSGQYSPSSPTTTRKTPSGSPTTPSTACPAGSGPPALNGPCRSPAESVPAPSPSTGRRSASTGRSADTRPAGPAASTASRPEREARTQERHPQPLSTTSSPTPGHWSSRALWAGQSTRARVAALGTPSNTKNIFDQPATTGHWVKSWPAPCTTTSTASSSRPWPGRHLTGPAARFGG